MKEVDFAEEKEKKEAATRELLDSGDIKTTTLSETLKKLRSTDQPGLYYAGGIRLLEQFLKEGK